MRLRRNPTIYPQVGTVCRRVIDGRRLQVMSPDRNLPNYVILRSLDGHGWWYEPIAAFARTFMPPDPCDNETKDPGDRCERPRGVADWLESTWTRLVSPPEMRAPVPPPEAGWLDSS